MEYLKSSNKIVIKDLTQFNINQILDCGQIFRYFINSNMAEVVSKNNYALITTFEDRVEIESENLQYFERFFDLNRDYNKIKNQLKNDKFLSPCINYGYGIRILNQDLFEMLISFIISANNNIKRIKNSLNALSKKFGTSTKLKSLNNIPDSPLTEKIGDSVKYYAFPTLEQLKKATVSDYVEAGLGYRADYMYETIQKLTEKDLIDFVNLTDEEQYKYLVSLKGVGEKVAHCILLFAGHKTSVFPVDTWINKVYNDLTGCVSVNRKQISQSLSAKYGQLSGYAQQYFFYYYRENYKVIK